MKTMLIPVDFTPTTDNAVKFAAMWCIRYNYNRIILLRSFYDTIFDTIIPSGDSAIISSDYRYSERLNAEETCETMAKEITQIVGTGVQIDIELRDESLVRAVHSIIETENVKLVVLGSDSSRSYANDSYVAPNVIRIARTSSVRLLIVPVHYTYQPVTRVLVPIDLSKAELLQRLNSSDAIGFKEGVLFSLLHVDAKERYKEPDERLRRGEAILREYMEGFYYDINYSNESDLINGIFHFLKSNTVQLIIALPGQHSFLYNLTHKRISEAIYRNAQEPVLILK